MEQSKCELLGAFIAMTVDSCVTRHTRYRIYRGDKSKFYWFIIALTISFLTQSGAL